LARQRICSFTPLASVILPPPDQAPDMLANGLSTASAEPAVARNATATATRAEVLNMVPSKEFAVLPMTIGRGRHRGRSPRKGAKLYRLYLAQAPRAGYRPGH
jgi:hypothetical protein